MNSKNSDQLDVTLAEGSVKPAESDSGNAGAATILDVAGADTSVNGVAADQNSMPESDSDLQPGSKLGKYEIRRKLGAGGMGAVYLGFDPMIEREVAIKVLPPEIAERPNTLERFLTEARATGKLNHPHIVAIYDIGAEGNLNYIVMEVLRGGSVLDLIESPSPLPWQEACRICADAADGLAAAHAAGLVHRDIKPENLMLTDSGIVKVVDFGLAKLLDATDDTRKALTKMGQVMGTPQFMSPEQFDGSEVDHRSDIYSLGGTLFQLLTKRFPFEGSATIVQLMYAHIQQPVPSIANWNRDAPQQCQAIVERAMAKAQDDRFQDAADLSKLLRELIYSPGQTTAVPPQTSPFSPEEYRDLTSVSIVSASKMQAMMLRDALTKSGVASITIHERAAQLLEDTGAPADIVFTSMQNADLSGLDLIRQLTSDERCRGTTMVLSSSDTSMDQLVDAGGTAPLALVSKSTRPDEILRGIHAATWFRTSHPVVSASINPLLLRVLIISDADHLPGCVSDLIREAGLLDIEVTSPLSLASGAHGSGKYDLALVLHTAGRSRGDTKLYASMLSQLTEVSSVECGTAASLQIDGDQVYLRAISRGGLTAVCRCPCDHERFGRVLQITS